MCLLRDFHLMTQARLTNKQHKCDIENAYRPGAGFTNDLSKDFWLKL